MCFEQDEKKLENICDFIWWFEIIFVPLQSLTETCGASPKDARDGPFLTTGARDK